jgi:hypothetical protein
MNLKTSKKCTSIVLTAGLAKTRVFLKKTNPGGFFWLLLGFIGFFGFYWVLLNFCPIKFIFCLYLAFLKT